MSTKFFTRTFFCRRQISHFSGSENNHVQGGILFWLTLMLINYWLRLQHSRMESVSFLIF